MVVKIHVCLRLPLFIGKINQQTQLEALPLSTPIQIIPSNDACTWNAAELASEELTVRSDRPLRQPTPRSRLMKGGKTTNQGL